MAGKIFVSSLRMYNIVPLLGMMAFLAGSRIWPPRGSVLERRAFLAFLGYAAFIAVVFVRSVPNLPIFHANWPDIFPLAMRPYLLDGFLLPMLMACSFLYVLRRLNSADDVRRTVEAIVLAVAIMAVVVLAGVLLNPDAFFASDPARVAILNLMTDMFGLHYNAVGTILAISAPLLLYVALSRGSYWSLPYWLALAAAVAAKSRTGIFVFAGGSVLTMVMLGRARALLAAAPLIGVAAIGLLGATLVKLLSIGVTQKSGLSLYLLLSGRDQAIWLPVILEWVRDPLKLFFGAGAHGILTSVLISSGATGFIAGQAHNLYLEFFVDNGIVLFALFLVSIGAWLRWAWHVGQRIRNGLFWSLYLCVVCFLVTGVSGRLYYPTVENYLLFPLLAVSINVARLRLNAQSGTDHVRPQSALP